MSLLGSKSKVSRSRLTVVPDVDETIASCGDKAFLMKAGSVSSPLLGGVARLSYVHRRSGGVLWSACSERCMRQVLNIINPAGIRISRHPTRDTVWFYGDSYHEENLLRLRRPMEGVVMDREPWADRARL